MKKLLLVVFVLVTSASIGFGYTFDQVDIEYWAGSGTNEALCVVDFGSGNNYAYGFRWETTGADVTAENMLLALDGDGASGTLDVQYHYDPTWGFGVDGFSYDGNSMASDGWITTYLGYWSSSDGETWEPSNYGAGGRVLANGDWDGWSYEFTANGFNPIYTPSTPVPEPATLGLMTIAGGMGLLKRRKKA